MNNDQMRRLRGCLGANEIRVEGDPCGGDTTGIFIRCLGESGEILAVSGTTFREAVRNVAKNLHSRAVRLEQETSNFSEAATAFESFSSVRVEDGISIVAKHASKEPMVVSSYGAWRTSMERHGQRFTGFADTLPKAIHEMAREPRLSIQCEQNSINDLYALPKELHEEHAEATQP